MELQYLTDHLFDLLNESEVLNIQDIVATDDRTGYQITVFDGSTFEVSCKQYREPSA